MKVGLLQALLCCWPDACNRFVKRLSDEGGLLNAGRAEAANKAKMR